MVQKEPIRTMSIIYCENERFLPTFISNTEVVYFSYKKEKNLSFEIQHKKKIKKARLQ